MNKNVTIVICTAAVIITILYAYSELNKKMDKVLSFNPGAILDNQMPNESTFSAKGPIGFKPSYMVNKVDPEPNANSSEQQPPSEIS